MSEGFIFLHRALAHHELWFAEPFTRGQAWVDLLMLANHKPGHIRIQGVRIEVVRGQVGWSEVALGTRWKWSRGKVRRFLGELIHDKMISKKQNSGQDKRDCGITILNYEKFQSPFREDGTGDSTRDGHATDMRRYTNKNEKNLKNQEKDRNTVGPEAEPSEPKPMNLFAADTTPASEPEQEPEDPKYSGFTVFHADGEMRISKRDFAAWQKAYSNLDLAAELQALSDWSRETREWAKKSAFMACSAALRKKNAARKPAEDTHWHQYRTWAERYLTRRATMHPTDTPEATPEEIDAGAKTVAGWIGPDGYTEQLLADTVAWLLQSPDRCQSVLSLVHLGDPVPKWGLVVTWASNGARGVKVSDNPQEAAA